MASNTIKNGTRRKFKHLLGINLVQFSSKFLAHIEKHLGHTSTLTNAQNNCIKLSDFGVDITFSTEGKKQETFRTEKRFST